jgi:outer membrane protein assembly factor BamB
MRNNNSLKYGQVLSILVLSLSLSACASLNYLGASIQDLGDSLFGNNQDSEPPAPLTEYDIEVELEVVWKESIGIGKDRRFLKLDLVLRDDILFVADKGGLLQARTAATGDLRWEQETDYAFSAGPGVSADTLILGSSKADVIAFSRHSGEKLWSVLVSSEVLASPVITQNIAIIRTTDGGIIALNEKDGHQLWSFEKNVPELSIRGKGKPLIVDQQVIVGYASGKLLSLDLKTGKINWESTIAVPSGRSEVERLVDLDSDPIEKDGIIYISSYNGGTTAVTKEDGKPLWRNPNLSAYTALNSDQRYLYLSDSAGDVWQLEQGNGYSLWKQDALHFRLLTTPITYDNYVVVGDYEGYVHWLSRSDGRLLNRIKVAGDAIDSTPVVMDEMVYIYAKDGTLAALKARLF